MFLQEYILAKTSIVCHDFFFFSSRRRHTRFDCDWSSDVCSSDLSLFSPTVPPLERLRSYCDFGYRFQCEIRAKHGCVLGCPLFSVGAEVSTEEDRLQIGRASCRERV